MLPFNSAVACAEKKRVHFPFIFVTGSSPETLYRGSICPVHNACSMDENCPASIRKGVLTFRSRVPFFPFCHSSRLSGEAKKIAACNAVRLGRRKKPARRPRHKQKWHSSTRKQCRTCHGPLSNQARALSRSPLPPLFQTRPPWNRRVKITLSFATLCTLVSQTECTM